MQQVLNKLIANINLSESPQDFCLKQEMVGGEEQQSPANGGGKSSQRRSSKRMKHSNHWIKKKVETLSVQLNPVPLRPLLLDIGAHKTLLKTLGLWDFLNVRFDGVVRRDLLTELVASYKYHPKLYKGVGYVHGVGVSLSRGAVANALHFPAERIHGKAEGVLVSHEQGLFIEKLLWDWLVLKDDGDDEKMDYVLNFAEELKELRLERADWAGLIWYMVDRELKKGKNLVNCYYSSHLQALLKHQRPELFEDDRGCEVVRSADKNSGKKIFDVGNGDGVESGLNASLLKKCCKREREFLGEVREDVVGDDDEGERLRKLHCADLASREFGDGDRQMEVGNLEAEGVCQRNTVHLLEKKEFLHNLQDQSLPEKNGEFSGGCLVVDLNCFAGGEFGDDDQLKECGNLEGVCQSDVVDSVGNEEKTLPNLQANLDKEIPAGGCKMEDEVNEVECKTSTLEKEDVIQSEANDKESEEECDVKEVKESEASFEAGGECDVRCVNKAGGECDVHCVNKAGGECDVRCVNEAGGTEDKENEFSVKREAKLEHDQHQPELRLENSTEENGESLANFADGEVDLQEVDLSCMRVDAGKDVDSVASVDLFAWEVRDKELNKECSTDGVVCQEIEKKPVNMEDDAIATLVNQPREAKVGDLLGDKEQERHMVQYQHQPKLELENAAVENRESLETQPVNMGSCLDNSGKEFVLEKSKEEDEQLFLPEKVDELFNVEMDSGGTVDVASEANIGNLLGDLEMKLHKVQDQNQPELGLESATEGIRESLADFAGGKVNHLGTRRDVDSAVSVHLLAQEVCDKEVNQEGSTDGLVGEEIENQPVDMEDDAMATFVNQAPEAKLEDLLGDEEQELHMIQDQHQPELELEKATEKNGESLIDSASGEVNCLVADSVDLYTHEVRDKDAKKEGSTGGLVCQEIENQPVDMEVDVVAPLLTQDEHQPEVRLEIATEQNGESFADFAGRECSTDDLVFQEIENGTVDVGSCQDNSGKEFALEISDQEEDEQLFLLKRVQMEMNSGGNQLRLTQTQSNKEDDAMATLVSEAPEGNNGDKKQKFHKVNLPDEEYQNPFEQLVKDEGNLDLLLQANGNASRNHTYLGQFPFDTDMAGCSFGIPAQHGQEADTENMIGTSEEHAGCSFGIPAQYGHEADTNNMIGTSEEHDEESMNLNLCAEKMKVWTARFMDSARRKVKERQNSSTMLQKKIEEQNQIIQQYELMLQKERQKKQQYKVMLQKERQQKQTSDHRYNRELYLMQSAVEDYRMAIKQTNTAFAKYRERVQFPEEPLYMPHPDGGGNVIRVSEWKELEKERQQMAIEAVVEEFEEVWMSNLEEQLSVLETHCDRLGDLKQEVKTMSGRI